MKKGKMAAFVLSLILSVAFLGQKCYAVYIYRDVVYTVSTANRAVGKDIKNPSTINDLTVYAYARPEDNNKINRLAVYKDITHEGSPVAARNFPGGESGTSINFELPANTTYYALISAISDGSFRGKFSVYY